MFTSLRLNSEPPQLDGVNFFSDETYCNFELPIIITDLTIEPAATDQTGIVYQ
jgi:hypothetical protein